MNDIWNTSGTALVAIPLITIGTFSFVMLYPLFRYGYIRMPRFRRRKRSKLASLLVRAASRHRLSSR